METNKKNLLLFPKYRQISYDFLFFYTINVLFLTQVKGLTVATVVLAETLYSVFGVLFQIPAFHIITKIGRRKGTILGNFLNCLYLIFIITFCNQNWQLYLTEIFAAMGFALKDTAENSILNESINITQAEKSRVFSRIQGKAISRYYFWSAISLILSGFLYNINKFIPITLSLIITIITLFLSTRLHEPVVISIVKDDEGNDVVEEKSTDEMEDTVSIKEALKFAFKSARCRCLLLYTGIIFGIKIVLITLEVSLLEDLNVSSVFIGILFAILNIVSSISSTIQNVFQQKFKNRTLAVIGISIAVSCILAGLFAIAKLPLYITVALIALTYIVKYSAIGLYDVFTTKYLSNFTNEKIDTQLFTIHNILDSLFSAILGFMVSIIVSYIDTAHTYIIFGIISLVLLLGMLKYMSKRVGLDPTKYSDYEKQYDKTDEAKGENADFSEHIA